MGWESFGVVRFDLGPVLQGQMSIAKLKSDYNSPIIGPRGFFGAKMRGRLFFRRLFNLKYNLFTECF